MTVYRYTTTIFYQLLSYISEWRGREKVGRWKGNRRDGLKQRLKQRWGKVWNGKWSGGERESGEVLRKGEGKRKGRKEMGEEGGKEDWTTFSNDCMHSTSDCMKFYYSLLSPLPLPPSPDRSIAPSRIVTMNMSMCHDVNFILGWPVTWGRKDREVFTRPTATRHCCALIGIWGVYVMCFIW